MPSHKDDAASAQRRRRARRTESADADSPYGNEGDRGNQNGNQSPDQSAATGSDDPRTASSGGNAGSGSGGASGDSSGGGEGAGGLQRSDRLDFDDRLIQGQTARAGAVYLFSRPPRDLPELVKLRRSFRTEISRTVLARDPITPATTTPAAPAAPARGAAATRNTNGQRTPEAGTPPQGENNGSTTRPEGREGRERREGRTGRRRGGPRNP